MIEFMLLFSRQGKVRLQKWYTPYSQKDKKKTSRELTSTILSRRSKMCNVLEYRDYKVVYKRYASLYFCAGIGQDDNELITLEIIHRYVELLDKYFGSVCELDVIFNYEKSLLSHRLVHFEFLALSLKDCSEWNRIFATIAYYILDELLVGGEIQETSKKNIIRAITAQDMLQEETENPKSTQTVLEEMGLA